MIKMQTTAADTLPKISQPAVRALASKGVTSLKQLANFSEQELAKLHGMGPKALGILKLAMAENGLAFTQR